MLARTALVLLLLAAGPGLALAQVNNPAPAGGGGGDDDNGDNGPGVPQWWAERYENPERIIGQDNARETPVQPQATPVPTQTPRRTNPVPRTRELARLPEPRPVFVDGIPNPLVMPLRTLGRPALLDAETSGNTYVALVELPEGQSTAAFAQEFGMTLLDQTDLSLLGAKLLKLEGPQGLSQPEGTRLLLADSRVIGAHPNHVFELQQASASPSPLAELQYAPRRMALARAHELTRGERVTVAVIDTGVETAHGEFAGVALQTFNAVTGSAEAGEPHGTAIAGLIAAHGNMTGIAPGASVLAVRAFSEAEDGRFLSDSFTIARAIDWAVVNGADVLNMSFAGPADPLVLKLMDEIANRQVIAVAAAGNNGAGAPAAYPAAHPATIAVTATDERDGLYQSANRGIYVTVAAPGVDVIAPAPGNTYELVSGTSIATAHLSGVVALMLARDNRLDRNRIIEILSTSTDDFGAPGFDPEYGYGLIDAHRATLSADSAAGPVAGAPSQGAN